MSSRASSVSSSSSPRSSRRSSRQRPQPHSHAETANHSNLVKGAAKLNSAEAGGSARNAASPSSGRTTRAGGGGGTAALTRVHHSEEEEEALSPSSDEEDEEEEEQSVQVHDGAAQSPEAVSRRGRQRGERSRTTRSGGAPASPQIDRVLKERRNSRSPASSSASSATSTSRPLINGRRTSTRVPGGNAPPEDETVSVSRTSSRANSWVEVSDDSVDEAEDMRDLPTVSSKRRLKCRLCGALAANRTRLKKHALVKHFRSDISAELPQARPFKCPFAQCSFEAVTAWLLQRHYETEHDVMEKFMAQVETPMDSPAPSPVSINLPNGTNGYPSPPSSVVAKDLTEMDPLPEPQTRVPPLESDPPPPEPPNSASVEVIGETDSVPSANEPKEEPVTELAQQSERTNDLKGKTLSVGPSELGHNSVPRDFDEFKVHVQEHLKTLAGSCAQALDECSIQCVCGQILRLPTPFHWQYLIQKHVEQEGESGVPGHWFTCEIVLKEGSALLTHSDEPAKITPLGVKLTKKIDPPDQEKRRSKRMLVRDLEEPALKRLREQDSDEDENEQTDEDSVAEKSKPVVPELNLDQHIRDLMATRVPGDIFLQDGPCFQMAFDLPMCHMCKTMPPSERRALLTQGNFADETCDISCCFYAFRKLRCSKAGQICVAGYLDPHKDPKPADVALWSVAPREKPDIPIDKVKYILGLIGDQFCDMVQQERKCLSLNMSDNKAIVWKPAVKGVREMCDVCKTTLFNFHWTCGRCGIFICLDCYQFRKTGLVNEHLDCKSDETDDYDWPLCNNREPHCMERLVMAQIIPQTCLLDLSKLLHNAREKWNITQFCHSSDEFAELYSDDGFKNFGVSTLKLVFSNAAIFYDRFHATNLTNFIPFRTATVLREPQSSFHARFVKRSPSNGNPSYSSIACLSTSKIAFGRNYPDRLNIRPSV